ncbi:uncharacterized protein K444DRAFT_203738 [Hyaloscypha bicolor E]|uniref:Uncharacterized protein n=1 Tax=Hyaloscypha bicolor E TaxID=1095630 RepID=A0A2J6TNQ8_9HELO|nr:uncharacterized protein K444DRAFT_203738 [Hyaloscypha bicolor E]PMD64663.1 hypothetical protein K444DRAFT_203738 [Hyaloscypha bicolor E]
MRKSTVSGQLGRQPLEPLGATAPSAANPCTKEPGERPAQPNRGPASLYRSSGQARLKPELASIFLISFQGRPGSGHARVFLLCSCPILQSTRPSLPSQELPTSHAHSYRNIGQSLLAGRLHPLRASSPGVPDATMHATVHTHHLGNSSSTQPRPTSPSATTLL